MIATVVVFFWYQEVDIADQSDPRPDAATYGLRGPYPVGMRNLVIEGQNPLDITIWYPALKAGGYEMVTAYPFAFKMGGALGMFGDFRVAKLGAQAIREVPYDLSESPYPVLVLSPGFAMAPSNYAWLAEHLASHSFVVVSPEHHEGMAPGMNDFWRAVVSRPQEILTVFDSAHSEPR